MRIGIIVLCRYNSSRLPGKILKTIENKPILTYILERLSLVDGYDDIIIATSEESSDDPIEKYCEQNNVNYFRGSLNNVAERFLKCAKSFNLDYAIRINGDNLFTDQEIVTEMIKITRAGDFNFITNVKNRTFPTGMSVEILNVKYYLEHFKNFLSSEYKEHVTLYFYQNPHVLDKVYYHYNEKLPKAKGLKLALDSSEDFKFAEKIIGMMQENHTNYDLKKIIHLLDSIK